MSSVSVLKLGRSFSCVPGLMYGGDRQIENSSKWLDRGSRRSTIVAFAIQLCF